MTAAGSSYKGFRFLPEIISHASGCITGCRRACATYKRLMLEGTVTLVSVGALEGSVG